MTDRIGNRRASDARLKAFSTMGTQRTLVAGEVLAHEGERTDSVYLVVSGELHVVLVHDDSETIVARCVPGETVGEVAALAGTRRSATIRAGVISQVVVIEPSAFVEWLSAHPDDAAFVAALARNHLHNVQVAEMAVDVLGPAAAGLVPQLLASVEWVDIDAGATLFEEGDTPDAAYFVLAGRLQVVRRGPDGEVVVGEIGRGEVVGESAVILNLPRSATVRALRDTTLARFDLASFEQLLTAHPQLLLMIVRRMVKRIAGERTAFNGARSVAVVVTADVSADDIVDQMIAELTVHGTSKLLSSHRVDTELERDGIAQMPNTDIRSAGLNQYLAELEAAHDHLLFLTDREPTEWSRHAIQRADCVVVLASAAPSPREQRVIDSFVAMCARTRSPRWLAMLDDSAAPRPTAGRSSPARASFDEVHHLRRGDPGDIARVTRLAIGAGYGLVLGGGGARGFAHLGVLRALRDQGVPVDRIGGASMGSIFAAMSALYRDHHELTTVCAAQFDRLLDYTVPIVALLKAKRISANLNEVFGGLDAEDLWLPFYCVSTNLTRSRLEVHRRGDLVTAIRASIAIPGVLPPVPFGDDLLVDGGVLNNVPADVMRADPSIGTVVAVDVAPTAGPGTTVDYGMYLSGWQALRRFIGRAQAPYPGVASVLVRTMITGSEGRRATLRTDGTVDLYLDLEMKGVGLLEFDKFAPVVEKGYVAAMPRIAEWIASRQTAAPAAVH